MSQPTEAPTTPVVIAIDGGQSSTTCLVGDLDGRPLGWAHGGPIWHIAEPGGADRVRAAIANSVADALQRAGVTAAQVSHAYLGLTGSADAARGVAIALLPTAQVRVDSDAVAALASGTFGRPGVAVIAGTGSVAVAIDHVDRRTYRGGWGPTLGDEGSGYWIGHRALRAAARADDGRGPDTELVAAIRTQLGLPSLRAVFDLAYNGTLDRTRIAGLTPLVLDCAAAGDRVAQSILDRAVNALADLTIATVTASDLRESDRRIVLCGGVLSTCSVIADALTGTLRETLPGYAVVRPQVPPVVGSLALALRAAGRDPMACLEDRLDRPDWPAELTVRRAETSP